MKHISAARILALTVFGLLGILRAQAQDSSFKIDDCKTRVSIAAVNLTVGELTEVDGQLVGDYSIKVPLKQSKNETGRIVLPLSISVNELRTNGGTLTGHAYSSIEGKPPNTIVCEILPQKDHSIRLAITTPHRTLNFKSHYEIIDGPKGS